LFAVVCFLLTYQFIRELPFVIFNDNNNTFLKKGTITDNFVIRRRPGITHLLGTFVSDLITNRKLEKMLSNIRVQLTKFSNSNTFHAMKFVVVNGKPIAFSMAIVGTAISGYYISRNLKEMSQSILRIPGQVLNYILSNFYLFEACI
jgi:hypothetical protein